MDKITPASKEHWLDLRANNINSTEVSALFGVSPYLTKFELWHQKKNKKPVIIEPNERMKWGSRLEASIANGIAEDNGWKVEPMKDYIFDDRLRIGSSFDYYISDLNALLEIKNVDSLAFKQGWKQFDNSLEAPLHIELQVQHQLLVSGLNKTYIGAFVGGNSVVLIERERDDEVIGSIKDECAAFWKSIKDNVAPNPDFVKDAEFIKELYNTSEAGKVLDASNNNSLTKLAVEYHNLKEQEKELSKKIDAVKAQMLFMIGDAEKIIHPSYSISLGMVKESEVSYVRKPYRNFKLNWKVMDV